MLLPLLIASLSLLPQAAAEMQVPAGTVLQVAAIRPLDAATTAAGTPVYLQTMFPVQRDGQVLVPAGTYVSGVVTGVVKPTRRHGQALLEVRAAALIFANGYSASLDSSTQPSLTLLTVRASTGNDLLLDNGAQFGLTLPAALPLNAEEVVAAARLSRAPQPGSFVSATRCRYVPGAAGTAGTPDTVIPGTPGTPDTVVPGANGMPDTVIPGTPATPDTVLPGIPGSPDTPAKTCPGPPVVLSAVPAVPGVPLATAAVAVEAKPRPVTAESR